MRSPANSSLQLACAAVAFAVAIIALMTFTAPAHAAAMYAEEAGPCGEWARGSFDEYGTMYYGCRKTLFRWDREGNRLPDSAMTHSIYGAAPSPDGSRFYSILGNRTIARYTRKADGTYGPLPDPGFALEPIRTGPSACNPTGIWEPKGMEVDTDAFGYIYVAVGGWVDCSIDVIAKFRPDGTLLTWFGDHGAAPGQFNVAMGLAVTRNGRTIYTGENVNARVQRFEFDDAAGQYRLHSIVGTKDVDNATPGMFSAVYDVAVDPWGYLYVADTTWGRIQKFTPQGQFVSQHWIDWGPVKKQLHGIAVDAHGNAFVGESSQFLRRTDAEPGAWPGIAPPPEPDSQDPVLHDVLVPNPTTTRTVMLGIDADDDRGVTRVRLASEDGNWRPWQDLQEPMPFELSAGHGLKGVYVQVGDAAGRTSGVLFRKTLYAQAPADQPPPHEPPVEPEPPNLPPGPEPEPELPVQPGAFDIFEPGTVTPEITTFKVPFESATRNVMLTLGVTDDGGAVEVRFANEDGNWLAWKAYADTDDAAPGTQIAHLLTAGLGYKAVYAQVRDADGRLSNGTAPHRITLIAADPQAPEPPPLDDPSPVLDAITIPPIVNAQAILATIVARDDRAIAAIRFANEDGNWLAWKPWVDAAPAAPGFQLQHLLSAGIGKKAVYAQVRDDDGHESNVLMVRSERR